MNNQGISLLLFSLNLSLWAAPTINIVIEVMFPANWSLFGEEGYCLCLEIGSNQ